jgi:hypothetical protein
MESWIDRIRKHAMTHYTEDGWDILIECWDDAYIEEHYRGCGSYTEAVIKISDILVTMDGWRSEVTSEIF